MRGELARFLVVGLANTAISFGAYAALTAAAAPAPLAAAAAFLAGAANGYVLNGRWTFRASGAPGRYVVVQLGGAGAAAASMRLLAGVPHFLAYALTAACVTSATFVALRRWTFGNGSPSGGVSLRIRQIRLTTSAKETRSPWTAERPQKGASRARA
jgi:putative flippase GtrA